MAENESTRQAPKELRYDGPTLAEWKSKGYKEKDYPPDGYAALTDEQAAAYRSAVKVVTNQIAKGTLEAAAKFYHFDGATHRTFSHGQITINPNLYEQCGGRWMAIYRAVKPDEISALDALVKDPKSGVTAITHKEWSTCNRTRNEARRSMSSDGLLRQSFADAMATPPGTPIATVLPSVSVAPAPETSLDALDVGNVG